MNKRTYVHANTNTHSEEAYINSLCERYVARRNRYNKEIRKSEENKTTFSKRETQRNETETNGHTKKPATTHDCD